MASTGCTYSMLSIQALENDRQELVECSTYFLSERVAKVSTGLIPPPFLITFHSVVKLREHKYCDRKRTYPRKNENFSKKLNLQLKIRIKIYK